jgi:hypothetical protein
MDPRRPRRLLAAALAALAMLGGCGRRSAYTGPVTRFRDASTVVIVSTKLYLSELNKVERDRYLFEKAAAGQPIRLNELEQSQVFSKDGINARLDALDHLAAYTELLYKLATSAAPDRMRAEALDLKKAVDNLSGTVSKLAGEDDKAFRSAAGRVFPVIADILQVFADRKLEEALVQAVEKGEPAVAQLIDAIRTDSEVAYERRRNLVSAARVAVVDQYNREFQRNPDPGSLQGLAQQVSQSEDRWEAFATARPAVGLEAMKRAHTALVAFARKPKHEVSDFASLVDAMESFAATARRVGAAVDRLRGSR